MEEEVVEWERKDEWRLSTRQVKLDLLQVQVLRFGRKMTDWLVTPFKDDKYVSSGWTGAIHEG